MPPFWCFAVPARRALLLDNSEKSASLTAQSSPSLGGEVARLVAGISPDSAQLGSFAEDFCVGGDDERLDSDESFFPFL
jgi:hypothetical protein